MKYNNMSSSKYNNTTSLQALLLETAMKSPMNSQYACAIEYHNEIISIGYNTYSSNHHCLKPECLLRA